MFTTRLLLFRAEAADRARVACMPDTTWPVSGYPPGSSRVAETPRFRCRLRVSARQQRFARARLPGPRLTPNWRLFLIAPHDGLQPTQHEAAWSLPPQGGSEGPRNLHLPHSTASRTRSYIRPS